MESATIIHTKIEDGARYYDEPVYVTHEPKKEFTSPVAVGVAVAFGSPLVMPINELTGYERVRLRWMKPDGKGGLIPK